MKIGKSDDIAKKIWEDEEKKKSQQFKSKLSERAQNKKLPKLARLKENNALECILCKFVCKEEISFSKHYSTPSHKKALEEFQRNYSKKTTAPEVQNGKKEGKLDVIIGVKRPSNIEYKIEEKYVLIESEEKENRNEEKTDLCSNSNKNNETLKDNTIELEDSNHIDEMVGIQDKIDNFEILENNVQNNETKEEKNKNEEKKKEENDLKEKEILNNLNKIIEGEEETFKTNIINNLNLVKKQKIEKKEEMICESSLQKENENDKNVMKLEENLQPNFFNWKKKKLF